MSWFSIFSDKIVGKAGVLDDSNTTGDAMIRAGVRRDSGVSDETGQNQTGISNDIAIIRRPDGRSVLLCIYIDAPGESAERRAKIIADVTHELIRPD